MTKLALALSLFLSSSAYADPWIRSGSDIYYSPAPTTITIGSVSYSDENGGPSSSCDDYVQKQCNGKMSCTYTGTDSACGVTSPSGQKNYLFVNFSCNGISYSKRVEAGVTAKIACPDVGGNVGIGTESPHAKLDVKGEVKFGNSSSSCNSANEGQQRYNSDSHVMEFCDGTSWAGYTTNASLKTLQSQVDTLKTQVTNLSKVAPACPTGGYVASSQIVASPDYQVVICKP